MFQNTCPPQITGCNMASNSTMKIHPGLHERERERERENATVWSNILDFSLHSEGFQ
jgi:hypothetical protein